MKRSDLDRRALAHGRNALRAGLHGMDTAGGMYPSWLKVAECPRLDDCGLPWGELGATALDLACVMYAQQEDDR